MKKFLRVLLAIYVIFCAPVPSFAWWLWVEGFPVQEGTQLNKLAADIHEVTEQLEMLKNHLAMLNSLKSRLMQLGNNQIMQVFSEAQSVLQNAKSLTADISNFGDAFKQHFPDYQGITSAVSEGKRLADDWRNVQEGYLKVLNMNAKNFDDEQQVRNKMIDTLNEADSDSGQTKAIQIIGAIVNHASFLLDRNNQELSGFMESYITRQQAEKQRQQLAQLPPSVISQIQGMKELLSENFAQVRSILQQVESITHFTDDIEAMLTQRHPEWQNGLKIDELKERNKKRDKQLKQTFEAYLKALNTTAKDFRNDEDTRDKLLSTLSNSEGQVQALQALGALLDHTSSIIARNEQTLQGFMTTFLETKRDEIDKQEQMEQSILEAYKSLQNLQAPGKSFTPGFH